MVIKPSEHSYFIPVVYLLRMPMHVTSHREARLPGQHPVILSHQQEMRRSIPADRDIRGSVVSQQKGMSLPNYREMQLPRQLDLILPQQGGTLTSDISETGSEYSISPSETSYKTSELETVVSGKCPPHRPTIVEPESPAQNNKGFSKSCCMFHRKLKKIFPFLPGATAKGVKTSEYGHEEWSGD